MRHGAECATRRARVRDGCHDIAATRQYRALRHIVLWGGKFVRKILGPVLLGLGGFLLIAGLLGLVWAPGRRQEDARATSRPSTYLEGTGRQARHLDRRAGREPRLRHQRHPHRHRAVRPTRPTPGSPPRAVMVDRGGERECVDGSEDLITASVDIFATDRVTALADDESLDLPADAVPHEGLVNKWPFDAEKKTYPYWDGTDRSGRRRRLRPHRGPRRRRDLRLPRRRSTRRRSRSPRASPAPTPTPRRSSSSRRPARSSNQTDDQQRYLADGTPVLDLQIAFTDDQVDEQRRGQRRRPPPARRC